MDDIRGAKGKGTNLMQKKIEYPSLVEQAYGILASRGITGVSKLALFNNMVNQGLLNKNGQPTAKALENGLIEAADYNDLNPIQQFKADYPQFSAVPDKFFQVDEQNNVLIGFKGFAFYTTELIDSRTATIKELVSAKQVLAEFKEYGLTDQQLQLADKLIKLIDRITI